MRTFRDMPAEDGLSYGLSLLYRSGWAGTDPALIQLRALMEARGFVLGAGTGKEKDDGQDL